MTEAAYISLDNIGNRYEFYNNESFTVPDHSSNHTSIEINIIEILQNLLTGENTLPFASNLRLNNATKIVYTYPDLIVFNEQPVFIAQETLTVNNPYLIIEIFESSNPAYNPSARFDLYQDIPTLKEYLMIDADSKHIIDISDRGEEWFVQQALSEHEGVHSYALNYNFLMADIYKNIILNAAD